MTALLLVLPALSLVVLGAHFMRAGQTPGLAAAIALLALLFVRRAWAARAVQIALLLGAAEWTRTLARLVAERRAAGEPHVRLAAILGAVAAAAAISAALFETRWLRERYGRTPRHSGI